MRACQASLVYKFMNRPFGFTGSKIVFTMSLVLVPGSRYDTVCGGLTDYTVDGKCPCTAAFKIHDSALYA